MVWCAKVGGGGGAYFRELTVYADHIHGTVALEVMLCDNRQVHAYVRITVGEI